MFDLNILNEDIWYWENVVSYPKELMDTIHTLDLSPESYSKIMIADFVLSLSRKVTDKIAGTGRWHIIKNRFGPDGITLPSKMNMSNGQIHIYEETSVQGKETKNDMKNGESLLRKSLLQKYKEVSGDSLG